MNKVNTTTNKNCNNEDDKQAGSRTVRKMMQQVDADLHTTSNQMTTLKEREVSRWSQTTINKDQRLVARD